MNCSIIFIINSIQNPRCIKRVNEYIDNGYTVKVYAFNRGGEVYNNDVRFDINYLDSYPNNLSYRKRLPIIYKSIKKVINENDTKTSIYYLFSLEVAMTFVFLRSKAKYMYEESDLMHTYLSNRFLRKALDKIDKHIIKKSLLTVFTSDGFRKFHFGDRNPENCYIIPNRLSTSISSYVIPPKQIHHNIKIGFVGHIRYESVRSFVDSFCKNFPDDEFHFYGDVDSEKYRKSFDELKKYSNCFFHGTFKTPIDLPRIYSEIDIVLSTYDIMYENVKYAEPNKIYEAIYFNTPIIVSSGCYLGEKVEKLGIGIALNALDEKEVIKSVNKIKKDSIIPYVNKMNLLGRDYAINHNEDFFNKLRTFIPIN